MMALWAPGLGGDLVITDPTRSRLLRFSARHTPAHREFSNTLLRTYDRLQTVLDRELSVWPGVAVERTASRTRSESADLERIPSPTAMPPT